MVVGRKVHQYRGHYIYPGRLKDSDDDVLGTWYVVHESMDEVLTSGRGYETLTAAKEAVDAQIGTAAWKYTKRGDEWMASGVVQDKDWVGRKIIVGTSRGEKHTRKVVEVVSKHKAQGKKSLTYVSLMPDSQIEENASTRLIATRVDRLLKELDSWRRYFLRTHETASVHLTGQALENNLNEVLLQFGILSRALECYRTAHLPRKHPLPAWLNETRRLLSDNNEGAGE